MGRPQSKAIEPNQARSGLADALFTRTQQRLFALLFGQPGRSFIKQALIDATGSGSGAVQRELARLVQSGLVAVTTIGTQKHYAANREAPIFRELQSIVTKTVGLTDPIGAALRPVAKKIELALVYGSVAKRSERAGSDVDLLIVSDELTLEPLFRRLEPVEAKLGRKVNPTLLTRAEFEKRRSEGSPFLTKILAGKPIILIGELHGAHATR